MKTKYLLVVVGLVLIGIPVVADPVYGDAAVDSLAATAAALKAWAVSFGAAVVVVVIGFKWVRSFGTPDPDDLWHGSEPADGDPANMTDDELDRWLVENGLSDDWDPRK